MPVFDKAFTHTIKPLPQGGFLAISYRGGNVVIFKGSKDGKEWKEISHIKSFHPFTLSESDVTVYDDAARYC